MEIPSNANEQKSIANALFHVKILLYSQVPNKRGGGDFITSELLKFYNWGSKLTERSEFEKRLSIIVKQQKQVDMLFCF